MISGRGLAVAFVSIPIALFAACGGSVSGDAPGSGGDSGADVVGTGGTSVGGSGGSIGGFGGTGGKQDSGKPDAGSGGTGGYVDPGCPDAEAPPPQFDCDPLGPNTCPSGQGCFPFIDYPSQPCDFEIYGATCSAAGVAQQGDPCGQTTPGSVSLCAPGLSCFITGQGTECLKLCKTNGPNTCPPGYLCQTTDVEGIGACN